MSAELSLHDNIHHDLSADCQHCFGLCCVALPYAKSADFAFDKDGARLAATYNQTINVLYIKTSEKKGFEAVLLMNALAPARRYLKLLMRERIGKTTPKQQARCLTFSYYAAMHEMLWYIHEALSIETAKPIHRELRACFDKIDKLTRLSKENLLTLQVNEYRAEVNEWLLKTSELVRAQACNRKLPKKSAGEVS